MTNKKFVEIDNTFIAACQLAGIQSTKRQASKWRNKKGLAFTLHNKMSYHIKGIEK